MKRSIATAVFCVLGLAACTQAPPPAPPDTRAADEKSFHDEVTAFLADWGSKDVEKIVSHYADDASVEIPDIPIIQSKDAMRNALKPFLADPNFAFTPVSDKMEVSKAGDFAYFQGHYTMISTDPKTKKKLTEVGKFVTVFKRQADGSWKAVQDINNEDSTPTKS
jgi:ketosteroid isomerase-like protein